MSPRIRSYFRAVKKLATPRGTLTQQSIASGFWVTALNVGDRVLQLIMVIVLARLIGPEEFGLMGIALLILAAFRRFSNLGLNQALVYNREENVDDYLDTTWTLNIGREAAIAGMVIAGAPLIASVFDAPRATDVLRVVAIGSLVFGFRNPGIVYFQKDLDFHREFVYKMSGATLQLIVAVGYALVIPNVWALVFGTLAKRVLKTGLSYVIHPYRPRPGFDLEKAKELVNYGKWITGQSMVLFLTEQGDDAVVGWLLGASSLGLYQMAYQLSNAPATEITHVISRVAFPAYSKIQDDIEALRTAFYRTLRITTLLAVPTGVGIAVVAPSFVRAFLGESWLPMVLTMQLLTVYGVGHAYGSAFGEVWKAIGRPDYATKLTAFQFVLMVLLFYPLLTRYGILGAAMVVVITSTLISRPISIYITARAVEGSVGRILRELAYPLAAGLVMGGTVLYVRDMLAISSAMVEFFALIAVGVVSYVGMVVVLETQFGWGLRAEFRNIRNAM